MKISWKSPFKEVVLHHFHDNLKKNKYNICTYTVYLHPYICLILIGACHENSWRTDMSILSFILRWNTALIFLWRSLCMFILQNGSMCWWSINHTFIDKKLSGVGGGFNGWRRVGNRGPCKLESVLLRVPLSAIDGKFIRCTHTEKQYMMILLVQTEERVRHLLVCLLPAIYLPLWTQTHFVHLCLYLKLCRTSSSSHSW